MREWIHAVIALVAWAMAIHKSIVVRRRSRWFRDKRVYTSWGFIICFALSVTFKIDRIARYFEAWTWPHNLTWLTCYVSVMVAMYFVALGSLSTLESPPLLLVRLNARVVLLIALAVLGSIYLFGIASAPQRFDCTIPRTAFELAFVGVMNGYVATSCLVSAYAFTILYRKEENPLARFRWGTIAISLLTVLAFVSIRLLQTGLGYFELAPALLRPLTFLRIAMEGIACLLWPVGLLSNRFYLFGLRCLTFVKNLQAARDLRYLQKEFERRCPSVACKVPSLKMCSSRGVWWYCRTDLCLYQMVVSIYDSSRSLARYLHSAKPSPQSENLAEVTSLYGLLEEASRATSYPAFVEAYRKAARTLQTEEQI